MFTKIYESIKTFIKENYKALLILLFVFVLFNYKLPYSVYTPGGMINMTERIKSDDTLNKSEGSINMTYVSLVKGTLPMLGLAKILPTWDIISDDDLTLDDENISDTLKRDKYYMEEAISNATLLALNKSNTKYEITKTDNIVTYIADEAKTSLKLYDNILKYDNITFTNFIDLKNYISNKKIGNRINFIVERNGKEIKANATIIALNDEAKVGLMTATINKYNSTPNISVITKSSESGPSGGLMTALAIYNALTKEDITKGRTIAGTGTIDYYGNVGEIGGVIYKVAGAEKKGAEIFLSPEENYEEAYSFAQKNNYKIKVVSVKTFDEVIYYLESGNFND